MAKKNLGECVKIKKATLETLLEVIEYLESRRTNILKDYRPLKDAKGNYVLDEDGSKKWGYVDLTEKNTTPEEWADIQIRLKATEYVAEYIEKLV